MKNNLKVMFYIKRKSLARDGKAPIMMRVTPGEGHDESQHDSQGLFHGEFLLSCTIDAVFMINDAMCTRQHYICHIYIRILTKENDK